MGTEGDTTYQNTEERNEDGWKNQVDSVEQGLTSDDDVESNVSLGGLMIIIYVQISGYLCTKKIYVNIHSEFRVNGFVWS